MKENADPGGAESESVSGSTAARECAEEERRPRGITPRRLALNRNAEVGSLKTDLPGRNQPTKKMADKPNTNWYSKALRTKQILDNRVVGSKAEPARKEGVSRAGVTQILNFKFNSPAFLY